MPHGWRSAARSPGSPSGCAPDRRGAHRDEVARAFADRARIDWPAVLQRAAGTADRGTFEALRRLDAMRGGPSRDTTEQPGPWLRVFRVMLVAGGIQTSLGLFQLAAAVAGGAATMDVVRPGVLAAVFAGASLLLGAAVPRDRRVFYLLTAFTLTASAFARPLAAAHPPSGLLTLVFRGIYPEAFAQAALWQFAVMFPSVRRFATVDVITRLAASAACVLGAALFASNLLLAYGLLPDGLSIMGRDDPRNLFWQLFACAALPALAVIVVRAYRAPWMERVKVSRFAWSVGAGSAPLLAVGLARSMPGVDDWLRSAGLRTWLDAGALSALTAMPLLATVAVLVDGPFSERRAARPGDGWFATRACGVRHLRWRLGRPGRHRVRLAAALERVRLARGVREISDVLGREIEAGVGASSVSVVDPARLIRGSALLSMLEESSGPIDLARMCEPFVLLPRPDREWLDASRTALAAAVRLREGRIGAVVLLGRPRGAEWFDAADRWFITTLLTAAAAAWESAAAPAAGEECGDECTRCGRLRVAGARPCCAEAGTRLAALPARLGSNLVVIRRLGAGGMGIVYLGRDLVLDRHVALKTLPGLQGDMVVRLRREARVMAALNHEAIATIYGFELWRGSPVLVMEYCPLGTLARALATRWLEVDEVLRLGVRLCAALAYMHGRGVLHRDIKPSNIGFTSTGAAKLLDFGLSAEEHPAGTRAYLPPEALAGAPPDEALDLWALALVLRQASRSDGRLARVLERALAPDPAGRFSSADAMGAALDAVRRAPQSGGSPPPDVR